MNQFDDGRSESREEGIDNKFNHTQKSDNSVPLSEHTISSSEMRSALLCARYIISTVIEDSVDQLNEMRSRLDRPFLSEGGSIEDRAIVLEGVAEALWGMVDQEGTDRQLHLVFDIARDYITFFGADSPELIKSHTALARSVIKLLGGSPEKSEVSGNLEDADLRATLYLIAERLLRIEGLAATEFRQDLERVIVCDLMALSDRLEQVESFGDILEGDIALLNSLVSCCQTAESTFFDEALTTLFHTLSDLLEAVEEEDEEDDIDYEDDEDSSEYELSPVTIIAHAATATMKALAVCQQGKNQELLWREFIEQSDSSDPFWSIALLGMSKIDTTFAYPYIEQLLIESAQYERMQGARPLSDEPEDEEFLDDSAISDQFRALLDLLAGNGELFPALERAMDSLKKPEQRAIARVCRQAQECDEIEFSTESVLSDGLFEQKIIEILTKSTPR